jgi:hypothetical protein
MLKRVKWFATGAVAGLAGARFAKRKVKSTAAQLAPINIAKSAAAKVREKGHDVADAVREGRDSMKAREAELRSKLGGETEPVDTSARSGQVLIDGRPADAERVIVLDQVREPQDRADRADRADRGDRDDHVGPRRISRRARRIP